MWVGEVGEIHLGRVTESNESTRRTSRIQKGLKGQTESMWVDWNNKREYHRTTKGSLVKSVKH